jgi:VWFA-related protein
MRRLLLAGAAAGAIALLFAQETDTVLRVDVDLVNVLFSVRDKRGALIPNLTKDDFAVYEDGKQQTVKHFTRESDLPLTIGLLVDVSRSQENLIEIEKHAAAQFFQQVLRPKDMAFLISFGSEAELLQDSTNSAALLRKGLDGLRLSTSIAGMHPGPVPTSRPKGTILFDAVYLAATEKLRGEVGRKVVVIISDGVDQGSRYDVRQAIEAAHKADTIIYSVHYADPQYQYFGGGDGDLKRMSEDTGGRMYRVDRKHTLDDIFDEIQQEVRSQYALSFTPTNPEKDGTFRKLEIKPLRKDLKVQARKGYYATPAAAD